MAKNLLIVFALLLSCLYGFAQNRTINGKVTSQSDGLPLPGVTVSVKGSQNGTQTDAQGNFKLDVPSSAKVLSISYLGYKQKDVVITGGVIAVVLEENQQSLSEVIITGYTPQNRREVAGSVATVKGALISQVPIGSFDQALQGRVPGVLIQANSGQPGAAANVIIRGRGSVLGSTNPLYLLDGIEISAADFSTLNSNDFANVSVLADAAATATYGSRGANGVIVITSKQGQAGRPQIRYDLQLGQSKAPSNKLKVMNTAEKLDYELYYDNPNGWSDEEIATFRTIDNNWEDILFQKGITKQHNLSVSGGTDKTKYLISGGLFNQSGTVPTTRLKRYNGRVNLSSGTKDFDFGVNSTFGYSKYTNTAEANSGINAPLNALRWSNPYFNPYNADGSYASNPTGQPNPLSELYENRALRGQLKIVANAYASYNIPEVPGLYAKVNAGTDYTSNETNNFVDPSTYTGRLASATPGSRGSLTRGYDKLSRYTLTSSIGYSKKINADHTISAALYNEIIKSKGTNFSFTGYGFGGPFENESGITPGTATNGFIPTVGGNGTESAILSYFTNINYAYKDRYFLQLSGRRDGSSRFGANKRYANFGAVALSWMISSEPFFQSVKDVISDLKYKVSYGSAGNQNGIGSFEARELYSRAFYNGASGLLQTQLASPNLQWERRTTFNTGFEFTAFKGRVGGTVEYYSAKTSALFLNRQLSRTTGYTNVNTNIGELSNKGIQGSINVDVIRSNSFNWSLNANLTYNQNKINKLYDGQEQIVLGDYVLLRPGEKTNSIYVVRYAGVNPTNGNSIYLDKNGNPTETYSANDRVVVGSSEIPFFGGFGTNVSYKGVELSCLFSFVKGNKIFNNDRTNVENPTYLYDNISTDLLREWRTPGQITDIPRADQEMESLTTRFIEKGDFLRLRNVMLSYDLPKKWTSSIRLSSLKVFVQGQNLLTWTKFRGFDPEVAANSSLTGAQYPALRTLTAGLSVGL